MKTDILYKYVEIVHSDSVQQTVVQGTVCTHLRDLHIDVCGKVCVCVCVQVHIVMQYNLKVCTKTEGDEFHE